MTDKEIIQKLLDYTNNLALSLESILDEYAQKHDVFSLNPDVFSLFTKTSFVLASLQMTPEYVKDWEEE